VAYFQTRPRQQKPETITLGNGVNTYDTVYSINKSEAVDSRNTSSRNYPSFSVRPGILSAFAALTTPNGAGIRNGTELHVVDGTVWKRWNGTAWVNVATGLANAPANFVEFNRETDRLTIMCNGTDKKAYNGSTVVDLTQADATRLITIDDNRLYTLLGSKLKCSGVLDPLDFTSFSNSVPLTIGGMEGQPTALTAHEGVVISFSDKTMHLLYGDKYDNFELMDPIQAGCVSHRSIVKAKGIMYFLDYGQFKVFTGGFPVDMSQKVKRYLEGINYTYKDKIVAGVSGNYVYLSIPYGPSATSNNLTLEYDIDLKNWYPIDTGYVNFFNIGQDLYGIKVNGGIEKMNTGVHTGTWYHETGILSPTPVRPNKTLSDIWMEIELPESNSMIISYSLSASGNDFQTLYTFTGSAQEQKKRVKIPTSILQNQERYRLKFSGTGTVKIHFLETYERVKER